MGSWKSGANSNRVHQEVTKAFGAVLGRCDRALSSYKARELAYCPQGPRAGRKFAVLIGAGVVIAGFFVFRSVPEVEEWSPVELVRVQGNSMAPLISPGSWVEVETEFYSTHEVSRGDIVLLKLPNFSRHLIKRVVAVPGDRVELRLTALYVDDRLLKNSSGIEYEIRSDMLRAQLEMSSIVPENSILAMGELRKGSEDSSRLGFIPKTAITGRVRITP